MKTTTEFFGEPFKADNGGRIFKLVADFLVTFDKVQDDAKREVAAETNRVKREAAAVKRKEDDLKRKEQEGDLFEEDASPGKSRRLRKRPLKAPTRALDIMDAMRANQVAAVNGDYDIAIGAAAPAGATTRDLDLQEWKDNLDILPAGDGAVARAVVAGRTLFTVTVQWDDSRGELAAQQFAVTGEL